MSYEKDSLIKAIYNCEPLAKACQGLMTVVLGGIVSLVWFWAVKGAL